MPTLLQNAQGYYAMPGKPAPPPYAPPHPCLRGDIPCFTPFSPFAFPLDTRQRRWRQPLNVGGYGGALADGSGGGNDVAELNDRMASMNLRAAQQHQQQQLHMAQQGMQQGMGQQGMGQQGGYMGMGGPSGQRMGQRPRSSPMLSPHSDNSQDLTVRPSIHPSSTL